MADKDKKAGEEETITFRGVDVRTGDIRKGSGGSSFTRVHVTCDFSDKVREQLQIEDLPEGYSGGDIKGKKLYGRKFKLTPNSPALEKYTIEINCKEVSDFKVISLKQGEDKPDERQLKFVILTGSKGACAKFARWIENLGDALGQLKLTYVDAPPEETAASDQNQLDLVADEPTDDPPADLGGSALASARQVDGPKRKRLAAAE